MQAKPMFQPAGLPTNAQQAGLPKQMMNMAGNQMGMFGAFQGAQASSKKS